MQKNIQRQKTSSTNDIPQSIVTFDSSDQIATQKPSTFMDLQLDLKNLSSTTYTNLNKVIEEEGRISIDYFSDDSLSPKKMQMRSVTDFKDLPVVHVHERKRGFKANESVSSNISIPWDIQDDITLQEINSTKSHHLIYEKEEEDEVYSIWCDRDNQYANTKISICNEMTPTQVFLLLYKLRSGTFPNNRQHLENEKVIVMAIHLARTSKKLLKKYFPTRQVIFDNDVNYSKQIIRGNSRYDSSIQN